MFDSIILAGIWFLGAIAIAAESYASPLSPQQERSTFHFADENLTAELVASEPDVVAPVAIAWDADGRLFVAEMTDYPSGPVSGRIRLLEDRDRDGRYERATIFADKIAFPNGVMPWNGGVLVTAAPDILFFKDTDGDGRADERRVLLTGFAEGNQQLRVNGLFWGLDNWIYGANGRSDGEVHWADEPPDKNVTIRRRDFRFRPATGEGRHVAVPDKSGPPTRRPSRQFEAIAGHSQFGCAHDDWGDRFPVFNNMPIRHVVIEQRYLDRQPLLAGVETVVPISAPDDKGRVYYLAPPTLLIPQASDYFTSACGSTVYRGDALGPDYNGNFFVCEPVHNLIQRRRLVPNGATFIAERTEVGKDFLASTDPWFHGVFTTTGPDGCLYVVDFYRKYVEHPAWVAEELKSTTPWRTGEVHGRIWRIHPKNWKPKATKPNLSRAKSSELVKHLTDANGWWRDTAQRLLVERQDRSVISALGKMARKSPSSPGRLHALYTLDGLGALTPEMLLAAFRDSEPHLRDHAIRLSEQLLVGARVLASPDFSRSHRGNEVDEDRLLTSAATTSRLDRVSTLRSTATEDGSLHRIDELTKGLYALVDDPDPRVRLQLALTLGELEGDRKRAALSGLAQTGSGDHWHSLAILTSVGPHSWRFWKMLADKNPKWFSAPDAEHAWFIDKLATLVAASRNENDLREAAVSLAQEKLPLYAKMVLLSNLCGVEKSNPFVRELLAPTPEGPSQSTVRIAAQAELVALSSESLLPVRLAAIGLLGRGVSPSVQDLVRLLLPENPPEVRSATVNALSQMGNPIAAGLAFDSWERYARSTRQQLIAATPRSGALAGALLTALEQGKILLIEVDPSTRQALQEMSDLELRQRAEQLFKGALSPDRDQATQKFRPAVEMPGDRKHGAEIFARTCLQCHAMQGEGARIGPDLSGIATHSRETLLVDILDPSRQVLPDFVSHTVVTTDGETLTGLIMAESTASVTVRRPNAPDATIQRNRIKELKADGKSLMPDGLEAGMTVPDMADLLSFLRQPEAALLPKEK